MLRSAIENVLGRGCRPARVAAVVAPFLLLVGNAAWADGPTIKLLKTIPVPVNAANTTAGAMYSFDISFVDPATGNYYLADRSNLAVDVAKNGTGPVTQIAPNNGHAAFAGFAPCVPPRGCQ